MKFSTLSLLRFYVLIISFLLVIDLKAQSTVDIFQLMERTDLTLEQINVIATEHFAKVGTGQGTGYKQYQRWYYERQFHTDVKGYFINPELEFQLYIHSSAGAKRSTTYTWTELG